MKYLKLLLILSLAFTFCESCNIFTSRERENYIEIQPTFSEIHNENLLESRWIRNPENLLVVHETLKKFGYGHFFYLTNEDYLSISGILINTPPTVLLDSLIITFSQSKKESKYYREFWERREVENNDSVVIQILKDIKYSLSNKLASAHLQLKADKKIVNDTLLELLKIEYRYDSLTNELAMKDFETLKELGFHNSAYNLLYEVYDYYFIDWDQEQLVKSLVKSDTISSPWFKDDTK